MSYDPRLIINKKHLDKVIPDLAMQQYSKKQKYADVAKFLLKASENTVHKIDGAEFVICHPEFTQFNKSVRDRLTELEVEYAQEL